jgi:glycosyltransferase involved in cell wall biosynthesis
MKEIFIISTMQILNGRTAGSQRVLKIAKSLSLGDTNVFICSFTEISKGPFIKSVLYPNIFHLTTKNNGRSSIFHLFYFIFSLNRFIKARKSNSVIYLYPTSKIIHDFIYLIYFKLIQKYKFFCEINELRSTNLYTKTPPANDLKKVLFYIKFPFIFLIYKVSEVQIFFYDGVIVISTSLEKYLSRYTKKKIRIPILCDISNSINFKQLPYNRNEPFKICFSGTISTRKEGFNLLFEAMKKVNQKKNVELHMYGFISEGDNKEINHLIEKHHLQGKIFYHGHFDPEDLPVEFLKYNLLILPRPSTRQNKYGFSTKLSEYMVSGIPVLVTDVSDNRLFIKDGHNGYIIPPGSLSEMTTKINEIIDNYNFDNSIVSNAYATSKNEFDYKLYTQKLINFFFNETIPFN